MLHICGQVSTSTKPCKVRIYVELQFCRHLYFYYIDLLFCIRFNNCLQVECTMGLTKQYRRYASCGIFNIVGTSWAGVQMLQLKGTSGKYVAVGACEHIFVWDLKTAE